MVENRSSGCGRQQHLQRRTTMLDAAEMSGPKSARPRVNSSFGRDK